MLEVACPRSWPAHLRASRLKNLTTIERVLVLPKTTPPYLSPDLSSLPLTQTSSFAPGMPLTMASFVVAAAAGAARVPSAMTAEPTATKSPRYRFVIEAPLLSWPRPDTA